MSLTNREKDKRHPFQVLRIGFVRHQHQQGERERYNQHRRQRDGHDRQDQVDGPGHRLNIRPNIEGIGGNQQKRYDIQHPTGKIVLNDRGQAVPGHQPDAGTYFLYGCR